PKLASIPQKDPNTTDQALRPPSGYGWSSSAVVDFVEQLAFFSPSGSFEFRNWKSNCFSGSRTAMTLAGVVFSGGVLIDSVWMCLWDTFSGPLIDLQLSNVVLEQAGSRSQTIKT